MFEILLNVKPSNNTMERDASQLYPAIQLQMEELKKKYRKQEEDYKRMSLERDSLQRQEQQLDAALEDISQEFRLQQQNRGDISEEDQTIQELEASIIQNQAKINQLQVAIREEQHRRKQRILLDSKNKRLLDEFTPFIDKAERLVQIMAILREKRRLLQLFYQ